MLHQISIKGSRDDICSKREEIFRLLIKNSSNIDNGTIKVMSSEDLMLIFRLYDRIFFGNWFMDMFKGKIKFSLSRRMTRSAGITLCPKNIDKIKPEELVIEIRIGVDFFFHYGMIEDGKAVCGIKTGNSLEALLLVLEHELCHVIEFILFKRSNCSGQRFKTIANNLFGHTESYHRLPTHKQIAYRNMGIKVGDTVSFAFEGRKLSGIIYNINKRATVMVRDKNGTLVDNQGNRYSKYYVPLKCLEQ